MKYCTSGNICLNKFGTIHVIMMCESKSSIKYSLISYFSIKK